MASCVFFVCHFVAGSALKLATGVISGAIVFVLLSTYFKLESYITGQLYLFDPNHTWGDE